MQEEDFNGLKWVYRRLNSILKANICHNAMFDRCGTSKIYLLVIQNIRKFAFIERNELIWIIQLYNSNGFWRENDHNSINCQWDKLQQISLTPVNGFPRNFSISISIDTWAIFSICAKSQRRSSNICNIFKRTEVTIKSVLRNNWAESHLMWSQLNSKWLCLMFLASIVALNQLLDIKRSSPRSLRS